MKRFFGLVLVMVLIVSLAFAVEGTIKLKVLGRAPLTGSVTNAAMARQIVKNHAEEIRKLENDELFLDLAEQVDKVEFREEIIPVGTVMHWMLFKDKFGTIHSLKNIEWSGQEPFPAFGFEILHNKMIYHFFVPRECGNICLYQIRRQPEKQPVLPSPPQSPQPSQPSEPKIIPPAVEVPPQPAPPETPIKKHHPNFKLKFGPWAPLEPLTFSGNDQSIDIQHNFKEYLPEYQKFNLCEDSESGQLYLPSKSFNYKTGDSVWLKQQRSTQIRWSGIQFNVGAEIRLWKGLWFGADYYQSRKISINVHEYTEDMYFKEVKYLGAYYGQNTESSFSACPPHTYIYCLKLNRRAVDRQTDYTAMTREIDLLLRYYFTLDNSSIAPFIGVAGQQFTEKITDSSTLTVSYPWKDKIISRSEPSLTKTKSTHNDITPIVGLTAEVRIFKSLSIATEGSWRKFPVQSINHVSMIQANNGPLKWKLKEDPWRVTATIKVLF